jgi:glucose-6-phosphate isomerase
MQSSEKISWEHFQKWYFDYPELGFALDLSRIKFPAGYFESTEPRMQKAFAAMDALEKGAIANPDENRMVGHYWLRNADLAPTPDIRADINKTIQDIKDFAAEIHRRAHFKHLLLIGIGGSALGPQFVSRALGRRMPLHVFDNTDPDGMEDVLSKLRPELNKTLVLVISKSGGTKETRNGMLEAQAAYKHAGLDFAKHAVAVTGVGSELDKIATDWLRRFPMWDWVGGRTSQTAAVGLLPAALQGIDVDEFLEGARYCDEETRKHNTLRNPAALLALAWHVNANGRNMVVLPYSDRLELFSRYLQQLIMESLGKEFDLAGKRVNQGLTVFGNKGSTDQHAYVQQLRDGLDNFFVLFVHVLSDSGKLEVDDHVTSGDYLNGFYLGTREALFDRERQSVTITLKEASPFSVGLLIALFERTVGLYASLININAYHQPGVEAGKKAAENVLKLQRQIFDALPGTAQEIANKLQAPPEAVFHICEHLAANRRLKKLAGASPFAATYSLP